MGSSSERAARWVAVGVVVGYVFGTMIASALKATEWTACARQQQLGLHDLMIGLGLALGFVLLGLTAAFARYLLPFICPRCDQPFFHGAAMEIGFTRHCVNCGVAVGTPMPATEEQAEASS